MGRTVNLMAKIMKTLTKLVAAGWLLSLWSCGSIALCQTDRADQAFGHSGFVAVDGHNSVLTSPDGAVWTRHETGAPFGLYGVTFGNGLFVAVGNEGAILTSR